MFDTYAATITMSPGQGANDTYLSQVREQVKNPTGPVLITGEPGNGKVGGLRHVLAEANIPKTVVFASLMTTLDIALTLPFPAADGKTIEHRPTSFALDIEEGSALIIDEYDCRHPALSDEALLRLAQHPKFRQVFVISNAAR